MVFKLITIAVALLGMSFGCANHRDMAQNKNQKEVVFKVTSLTPHCGGMAPMPGVKYPTEAPMVQYDLDVFSIDNKGNRGTKIGTLKTDENGIAKMNLSTGAYQLWRPDKLLTLEEFMNKNKTGRGQDFVYANEDCFQKWKDTPDGEFKSYMDTVYVVYKRRCNVGDNPCMNYTGPAAP